jgi:2-succinyl-5-enolpyruvyl-6-hydroxy-3-cyclohexene-1-carboxylate synthase
MRALACRAVWTALSGRPGAVHLNFPLREPLVLDGEVPEEPGGGGRPGGRPWVARAAVPASAEFAAQTLLPIVRTAERGVLVAGRYERGGRLAASVAAFAQASGWPVLADPLSGARGSGAVAHYDHLLRHDAFAAAAVPDVVIRVGDLPTSKPLRAWLDSDEIGVQVAIDAEDVWHDPATRVDLRLPVAPEVALESVAACLEAPEVAGAYLSAWLDADARAAAAITSSLGDELTEMRAVAELGTGLPSSATLVVASSMPIRDVESLFPARPDPPRVLSNRGANGIDGTVSTAFGVAAGTDGPVVLLIGDVALAHDIGGLLAAHRTRLPLTIVLFDNAGGGIFDFLPVSSQKDVFEEHVATPTGLDPARVADLYGLDHAQPRDLGSFRASLDNALASDGVTLIEVRSDRAANLRLHRRVADAVAEALS